MTAKHSPSYAGSTTGTRIPMPSAARARRSGDLARGFDTALVLLEEGHWQRAFARLAQLADLGHPQAARIALLFVRRGTLLFGGTFHASAPQRECWLRASD